MSYILLMDNKVLLNTNEILTPTTVVGTTKENLVPVTPNILDQLDMQAVQTQTPKEQAYLDLGESENFINPSALELNEDTLPKKKFKNALKPVHVLRKSKRKRSFNVKLNSNTVKGNESNDKMMNDEMSDDFDVQKCCICGDTSHSIDRCPYVPVVSHVPDKEIPSRARASLPDSLELRKLVDNTTSVFAGTFIPAGTEFGPLYSKKYSKYLNPSIDFPLKIFSESNKPLFYLDTGDENYCNWMTFVNPANFVEDQNLICYQKDSQIYFATVKDISPGEPLKVWYAPFYASKMRKKLLGFETLVKQHEKEVNHLNKLVEQQQSVVPRDTWNCKFCYKLENNVTSFASHLLRHYKFKRQKRCETCFTKFKQKLSYLEHLKNSKCSKTKTKEDKQLNKIMSLSDDTNSNKNANSGGNKIQSDYYIGGPLLQSDLQVEGLEQSNIILEKSLGDVLDIAEETYNVENENLTLSVDLLINQNIESSNAIKIHLNEEAHDNPTCDICLKKFISIQALSKHMISHTGKFYCSHCKRVFCRNESLKFHSCLRHYNLKCKICGSLFYQDKHLKYHMEAKHKKIFLCKKCNKSFASSRDLQDHNCAGVPIENKTKFNCTVCNKLFYCKKYLRRHMNVHKDRSLLKKINTCSVCGQSFSCREAYRRHVRLQHKESSFVCDLCGKKFTRSDTVRTHIKEHHGLGSARSQCHICNKIYDSKRKLDVHIKWTHSKKADRKIRDHKADSGFACPICKKKIKLKSSLRRHMKSFHSLDITVKKTDKPKDLKPKRIYTTRSKDEFIKKDDGYICPFCPTITKLKNSLRRHIRNKHPEQKPSSVINKTDEINAELDKMIEDDLFKDLEQSIGDLNFPTEVVYTMDNLIENNDTLDNLLKEKTSTNSTAFNLSDDISIIPVSMKKSTKTDVYLSMPDLM